MVWIDRKLAALRRFQFRPMPTPQSEIKAGLSQYRIDQEESAEIESLKAKLTEKAGKPEKVKAEPKPKAGPVKKVAEKPKSKPVPEGKSVAKVEKGPHVHDFNSFPDD